MHITANQDGPAGTFMIAGEGPYCNWCGQHTKAQAERDALKATNKELVEALQLVPALRPLMLKEMGYVPESVLNVTNAARAVLDKLP